MLAKPQDLLLQHYVDKYRRLPWRVAPGTPPPDPYLVWLSEVMLQQTTVAAVTPRFERFVARWPTIDALAAARDEEVLGEWAGLGYYARARNLIACARAVSSLGAFPDTEAGLRRLPGIGDYTAAAIAAIAFGRQTVAVDGNVERVAARLFGMQAPTRPAIRDLLEPIVPTGRSGDFAQALMDLGATICRPRRPPCGDCPLSGHCVAFASGDPERFPAPKVRRHRPLRYGICHWIERDGHVWLVRRPARGLLGAMPALPGPDWTEQPPEANPPVVQAIATVRHIFTHFELRLAVIEASETEGRGWWHKLETIETAGLPTLYRKAVDAMLGGQQPAARHAA